MQSKEHLELIDVELTVGGRELRTLITAVAKKRALKPLMKHLQLGYIYFVCLSARNSGG